MNKIISHRDKSSKNKREYVIVNDRASVEVVLILGSQKSFNGPSF